MGSEYWQTLNETHNLPIEKYSNDDLDKHKPAFDFIRRRVLGATKRLLLSVEHPDKIADNNKNIYEALVKPINDMCKEKAQVTEIVAFSLKAQKYKFAPEVTLDELDFRKLAAFECAENDECSYELVMARKRFKRFLEYLLTLHIKLEYQCLLFGIDYHLYSNALERVIVHHMDTRAGLLNPNQPQYNEWYKEGMKGEWPDGLSQLVTDADKSTVQHVKELEEPLELPLLRWNPRRKKRKAKKNRSKKTSVRKTTKPNTKQKAQEQDGNESEEEEGGNESEEQEGGKQNFWFKSSNKVDKSKFKWSKLKF